MANEFVIKNGYFSQGNSNVTGSLVVTQNVTASKALFSSSGTNQLMVLGSGSSSWLTGIYGSQGNLLTVTDTFSGSLFTVTDISGYTILDIASDYYTSTIQMVGTASLTGSLSITENLEVKQNLTASKALISSSGNEQLMVIGSGSDSWITGIYGSQGNLLTVTDTFSGSLFTVSDISGYPILDVVSDYYTSSVYLPTLLSQSQQNVIVYDSQSGLLSYMTASDFGGGGGGPSTTINNNIDNYIITATGTANTLNGEANLQFDGSTLNVTGKITATSITSSLTGSLVGSLTGTASWAQSASQAVTASFWGGYKSTSSLIGGSGLSYNIDHNFGTRNVHVTVYSSSGTYETVYPDVQRPTGDRVTILFNNAPATDEFTVYISQ